MMLPFAKCRDTRECFARNSVSECTILLKAPCNDGECRFCKPDKEVTKGRRYPLDKSHMKA